MTSLWDLISLIFLEQNTHKQPNTKLNETKKHKIKPDKTKWNKITIKHKHNKTSSKQT